MQNINIFKSFRVNGLLGIFNHSIELKQNSSVTIVTAPNGFGKTSLLKAINYFYNDIGKLFSFNFISIEIEYDNQDKLTLEKKTVNSDNKLFFVDNQEHVLEIALFTGGRGRPKRVIIKESSIIKNNNMFKDNRISMNDIEKAFPEYRYIGAGRFKHMKTDVIRTRNHLINKIKHMQSVVLPVWLEKLVAKNVKFIETQRLLHNDNDTTIEVVKKYAEDLSRKIEQKLTISASIALSLDRTFPKRLLENETTDSYSEKELKKKFQELEKKRNNLIDVGILDKDTSPYSLRDEKINDCQISVLSFYANDIEKKLQVYDEIYTKIKILKDLCNSKFKYKTMHFSKTKGYYFRPDNSDIDLPLNELSSGEQHEVVLNYQLLFLTEPNSLVLIDEPELSLHVGWQVDYIPDLEKINNISKFHSLIATHSPQIINGRWSLVEELSELTNEK